MIELKSAGEIARVRSTSVIFAEVLASSRRLVRSGGTAGSSIGWPKK